ncbi:MAG: NADH-quinone oxidoreductase subunit J [Deltaproteobacteria bacterium]|nr:MAG: NADH-quinone oxidoreductase subunit J [Deltaproteobacteria bacterium]
METILFFVLSALLIAAALGVILARNPINSAVSLIGAFFFLSALYVLLRAHLIAALQVLVYAGAIMVLFVFVIMLLSLTDEELGGPRRTVFKVVGAVAAGFLSLFAAAVGRPDALAGSGEHAVGTVKAVAHSVYTDHVLAFEITAVLLLVAIVGAVVVAKRRI